MPTDKQIEAAAKAMADKRQELIAQPLSRIWGDLARAARAILKRLGVEG